MMYPLEEPQKVQLTIRLEKALSKDAANVAFVMGISVPEYMRLLVINDLDRRGLLNARIAKITINETLKSL